MKIVSTVFLWFVPSVLGSLYAQSMSPLSWTIKQQYFLPLFILLTAIILLWIVLRLEKIVMSCWLECKRQTESKRLYAKSVAWADFNRAQLKRLLSLYDKWKKKIQHPTTIIFAILSFIPGCVFAQNAMKGDRQPLWQQGGVIITVVLVIIPILLGIVLMVIKLKKLLTKYNNAGKRNEALALARSLEEMTEQDRADLLKRTEALDYALDGKELGGHHVVRDDRGLLSFKEMTGLPVLPMKKKALPRPHIATDLARLIKWYFITATFWLVFGTTVGEYLGVKFIAPDIEGLSWLSFGRLRPVHTNAVFWGWASLGMLGLGYYIVPRVSNVALAKLRWGWYSLVLINAAVAIGSISLMAGINNGGGEYREYIWPIMALFAVGVGLSLGSFYTTVARRKTKEIYISNWYIICAIIFIMVTAIVGYVPSWQDGLGETIVQGYYMHQAVGMWFMLFTLGIVYYFLPQQLNQPIYSYSLGILAFWSQILFYTLIGTHHFVFSAIAWWIQTVAIVASVGMVIPVIAGTTNFLMTFRGAWYKLKDSYTLPFFLVGIIFYFTGSLQGTAQAFRYTNLIWHFTDFTVAHSHMTMYGIITFLLWGGMYALVPRLTGKEAPQSTMGAHFWLALIGLMIYSISLMYGGTLRGLAWMDNVPFIESVSLMMPYWLWRAIGGSLMWISHLFFAYNLFCMLRKTEQRIDVREEALELLEEKIKGSNT